MFQGLRRHTTSILRFRKQTTSTENDNVLLMVEHQIKPLEGSLQCEDSSDLTALFGKDVASMKFGDCTSAFIDNATHGPQTTLETFSASNTVPSFQEAPL